MPETVIKLPENGQEQYYVYGKGRLLGIYAEPGKPSIWRMSRWEPCSTAGSSMSGREETGEQATS